MKKYARCRVIISELCFFSFEVIFLSQFSCQWHREIVCTLLIPPTNILLAGGACKPGQQPSMFAAPDLFKVLNNLTDGYLKPWANRAWLQEITAHSENYRKLISTYESKASQDENRRGMTTLIIDHVGAAVSAQNKPSFKAAIRTHFSSRGADVCLYFSYFPSRLICLFKLVWIIQTFQHTQPG